MCVCVCVRACVGVCGVLCVCVKGGLSGWVMEVWPLMPNQPPGPRLGHSLVSYPLLHLGMNGIKPNPVYRHP